MTRISPRFWKSAKTVSDCSKIGGAIALLLVCTSVCADENAPLRVLPLTPALAEWASELVGLEPIVGITEYTDYPKGIETKPKVGTYNRINFEVAMSLKPTLVLASRDGNARDQIEKFREKNVNVILTDSTSFNEMIEGMRAVAHALGKDDVAEDKIKKLKSKFSSLAGKYAVQSKRPRSILVQVSSDPLIVAGRKTYLNDLLKNLNFENIVTDQKSTYPRLSIESALSKNPEVILILAMKDDPNLNDRMRSTWSRYPKLKAVKENQIHLIYSDELMRPGMRLIQGMEALETELKPKK